jgi:hypothetical protein
MWIETKQSTSIRFDDISQLVVPVIADVFALVDEPNVGQAEFHRVGRIMADRLDTGRITAIEESVWDVADSDSSGLEAAWANLLDEHGEIRAQEFAGAADPVIYLYRFALHPDFVESKMAVMDMFCHTFGKGAIILAQHHTTLFSDTEFRALGFRFLPSREPPVPGQFAPNDTETRFWARENCTGAEYGFSDYPDEVPPSLTKHEAWVEKECPHERLC